MKRWEQRRSSIGLVGLMLGAVLWSAPPALADWGTCATDWNNFTINPGFMTTYTYKGRTVRDHETSSDPSHGPAAVSPANSDIASGSSNGDPGPYTSVFYGYYDGGTAWDPNNPVTMEDDHVMFRIRVNGDPRAAGAFDSRHWNVLFDLERDGYKEYWIDLEGDYKQNGDADRLNVLYDNNATQLVADPDFSRVEFFTAWGAVDGANCGGLGYSHTRTYAIGDGTGEWYIDIQVPMTAFNDLQGNQVLYPDSPVSLVFTTSASNTDPLQKDHMQDLCFISSVDPICFGDVITLSGLPLIEFTDADQNLVDFYRVGDPVFVMVTDRLANTDSTTIQCIVVTVTDPASGDDEAVTLCETSPSSGIFTNEGGACDATANPSSTPPRAWLNAVSTSSSTVAETWTLTFTDGPGSNDYWTVSGSVSGAQAANATAGAPYCSATPAANRLCFTVNQNSPSFGTTLSLCTLGADPLLTSSSTGADDDGTLTTAAGRTIYVSYTNAQNRTVTDTAQMLGTCGALVQFTRADGLPTADFNLTTDPSTSDRIYITVFHAEANTNPSTVQTITVTLTGNDTQTLTLTETGANTGEFRNTTGLQTKISDGTVAANDGLWEDVDGGTITATYSYTCGGSPYTTSTTASVLNTVAGGRIDFRNGADTQDVSVYTAGQPVFLRVRDVNACETAGPPDYLDITVVSDVGDSETVRLYETFPGSRSYMNKRNDLVTTAGSAVVTSASSSFIAEGVTAGGKFAIATGANVGVYTIQSVDSPTQITLTQALTASATGIGFNARPLMTATYDGSYTANDRVLEAVNQDDLTARYTDCNDGDLDPGNNVKTDTALYNAPSLVINRVLFYPDSSTCQTEFVEIYNQTAGAVNTTGYSVRDEDSQLDYTIPQFGGSDLILQPGERIIVSINGSATDFFQSGAYYLFTSAPTYPSDLLGDPAYASAADRADQVALFNASGSIIDYFGWSHTSSPSLDFLSDDQPAVAGLIWQDDAYRSTTGMAAGQQLQRSSDGFDTNAPGDWVLAGPSTAVCDTVAAANRVTILGLRVDPAGRVEFATGTQIGTLGFNLYGVPQPGRDASRLMLNRETVRAAVPSSAAPILYRVETAPVTTPYVLIEEIELDGRLRTYGPFPVGDQDLAAAYQRLERRLDQLESVERGAARMIGARRRSHADPGPGNGPRRRQMGRRADTAVAIRVEGPGTVEIPFSELADMGVPQHALNGRNLRLTNLGRRVGFQAAAGTLVFRAGAISTDYTAANTYVLSWAGYQPPPPGVPLTRSGVPPLAGWHRVAPDWFYVPFAPYGSDPWIWGFQVSGLPGWPSAFDLPGYSPAGAEVAVRVAIAGASDHAHTVEVVVNGHAAGRASFAGKQLVVVEGSVPASLLRASGNEIQLEHSIAGDGDPYAGFILLDSLDLGLSLPVPDGPAAAVSLGPYDPRLPLGEHTDYLIVTHPEFQAASERFAAAKAAEGHRPLVVSVERAYDRYSSGLVEANAVHALIREIAARNRLRFVLLVGDDTFDPKDNMGAGLRSFVPSLTAWDGLWGVVPSENRYADLDGDLLPDLAIGRLPVRTPEEADLLVGKLIQQKSLLRAGAGRHLYAIDNHQAGSDLNFFEQASGTLAALPSGSSWTFVQVANGIVQARRALIDGLKRGAVATHYFGHGGHETWADESLLSPWRLGPLADTGTGTVVFTWTCETQWYQYDWGQTINESLLLLPGGGAVAVVGPTGIHRPHLLNGLMQSLYARFFNGATLGEALQQAKVDALRAKPETRPAVEAWSLLGDPSLRLEP
jgi:hypothetical protein